MKFVNSHHRTEFPSSIVDVQRRSAALSADGRPYPATCRGRSTRKPDLTSDARRLAQSHQYPVLYWLVMLISFKDSGRHKRRLHSRLDVVVKTAFNWSQPAVIIRRRRSTMPLGGDKFFPSSPPDSFDHSNSAYQCVDRWPGIHPALTDSAIGPLSRTVLQPTA